VRGEKSAPALWRTLLPLTVPEVRRLLIAFVFTSYPVGRAILAWSLWRRRHQQRAKQCHWKRRLGKAKTRL
jgi:hypothetical protein